MDGTSCKSYMDRIGIRIVHVIRLGAKSKVLDREFGPAAAVRFSKPPLITAVAGSSLAATATSPGSPASSFPAMGLDLMCSEKFNDL